MAENKYLLTKDGLEKVQNELKELLEFKRPEVIKQIQLAREQGDLSENADYDAAKDQQVEIESRIEELSNMINNYEIVSDSKNKLVGVGSKVTILDLDDNEEHTYEIVGEVEANPTINKISNVSPLAKAILGKYAGEEVQVLNIKQPYNIKIVKLS
jgi:transcription elongation factor GreA